MSFDEILTKAASQVVSGYAMTGEELLQYIALGTRRHPSAPDIECGAIDPRDKRDSKFCQRPRDHGGDHSSHRMEEDWPNDPTPCPICYAPYGFHDYWPLHSHAIAGIPAHLKRPANTEVRRERGAAKHAAYLAWKENAA